MRQAQKLLVSSVIALLLAVSSTALAQETLPPPPAPGGGGGGGGGGISLGGERFGTAHTLAISSDANVAFHYYSYSPGSASSTTFAIQPAADFFVIDKLSVGGMVSFSTTSYSGGNANTSLPSTTIFGIGPRVGYDIDISDLVSFWPKGGFTFSSISSGGSDSRFSFNAYAPFLFHLAPHFFVGIGPDLNVDLSGTQKVTEVGAAFTIGGWLGL